MHASMRWRLYRCGICREMLTCRTLCPPWLLSSARDARLDICSVRYEEIQRLACPHVTCLTHVAYEPRIPSPVPLSFSATTHGLSPIHHGSHRIRTGSRRTTNYLQSCLAPRSRFARRKPARRVAVCSNFRRSRPAAGLPPIEG